MSFLPHGSAGDFGTIGAKFYDFHQNLRLKNGYFDNQFSMIAHAKIFKLSYHVERALTFVMHAEGSRAGRRTLCVHCDITYQVPCTVGTKKGRLYLELDFYSFSLI